LAKKLIATAHDKMTNRMLHRFHQLFVIEGISNEPTCNSALPSGKITKKGNTPKLFGKYID
jgi:hypothetical protein